MAVEGTSWGLARSRSRLERRTRSGSLCGTHTVWSSPDGLCPQLYTLPAGTSPQDHNGTGGRIKPAGTWRGDLACTMKLWLLACLVACFLGAWVPVVHVQGGFEDCCLGYQPRVRWNILLHARHYQWQEVSGSCNLRAVKFYFRHKGPVCMNPRDKDVMTAIRMFASKNKRAGRPQKSTPGPQTERKKSNHAKSKVGKPSSTSMRNVTAPHSRLMARKMNN